MSKMCFYDKSKVNYNFKYGIFAIESQAVVETLPFMAIFGHIIASCPCILPFLPKTCQILPLNPKLSKKFAKNGHETA